MPYLIQSYLAVSENKNEKNPVVIKPRKYRIILCDDIKKVITKARLFSFREDFLVWYEDSGDIQEKQEYLVQLRYEPAKNSYKKIDNEIIISGDGCMTGNKMPVMLTRKLPSIFILEQTAMVYHLRDLTKNEERKIKKNYIYSKKVTIDELETEIFLNQCFYDLNIFNSKESDVKKHKDAIHLNYDVKTLIFGESEIKKIISSESEVACMLILDNVIYSCIEKRFFNYLRSETEFIIDRPELCFTKCFIAVECYDKLLMHYKKSFKAITKKYGNLIMNEKNLITQQNLCNRFAMESENLIAEKILEIEEIVIKEWEKIEC